MIAGPECAQPAPDDRGVAGRIGHDFANPILLREALTHTSVERRGRHEAPYGYQRLEFLGDRVIGLVVADCLIARYPTEAEGPLARRLAGLVRAETIARVAQAIDLGPAIRLSAGEQDTGGRASVAILSDVMEAVVGAVYLDAGFAAARALVMRLWAEELERNPEPPQDPKTALQEWAQARRLPLPRYDVVGRTGPDHSPRFEVRVEVTGLEPTAAIGPSKREAERTAAAALLRAIADRP